MSYSNKQLKTLSIPKRLFESMIDVYKKMERFSDEFEDFVLAHNEEFIKKMERARKEHKAGKKKDLEILKQEL